ncbi:MAG: glucosaminidase domain-containing protein [Saprospiraceae bacterium]|nr:glucosaminidase domain-containing protein [Saprospiraceae bacterium]MDW8229918.1 glucosaminidase domain-containing protein [Saprospiraceae bacterium]
MISRIFSRSPRSAAPVASSSGVLGLLWRLICRHWFTLALALLVLLALWRRRPPSAPAELIPLTPMKEAPERFTQRPEAAPQSASLVDAPTESVASTGARMPALDDATTVAFLQRFARTAIAEQERFGMPASVLLASAYVNSFAGKRKCAVEANNYVAMRCTADWPGAVVTLDGACYRRYNTAWESLRDFNAYYSRKAWYAELKKNAGRDWRKWLKGLAAQGVSDVANFEAEATRVITAFRVYELDEPTTAR